MAYSMDLRERVVAAMQEAGTTIPTVRHTDAKASEEASALSLDNFRVTICDDGI